MILESIGVLIQNIQWLFIPLVLFFIFNIIIRVTSFIAKFNRLPGPATHWLLGELPRLWKFLRQGHHPGYALRLMLEEIDREYQLSEKHTVAAFWLGPIPIVFAIKPESAGVIFNNNNQLMHKSPIYQFYEPWLGDGILVANGHKWSHARKMLAPAFHLKVMDECLPKINRGAKDYVNQLTTMAAGGEGRVADIAETTQLAALDIICDAVMAVRRDTYTTEGMSYSSAVNNANLMFFERLVNPLWLADFIYYRTAHGKKYLRYSNKIRAFITSLVYQRKYEIGLEMAKGMFNEKKPKGVMDTLVAKLIKGEPGCDERFVVEEVTTIVFDGHETTGWGMVWAIYLLGQNLDAQRKLQEEVDAVFGADVDKELTAEDLAKMPYVDMVIKEAQRIIPSVPIIARRVLQDSDVDGHIIPVGATLGVLTHQIHRDQRFWPEPEKFVPERFEPENAAGRHVYAHIPFSAGPRNCLGQKFAYNEEKIVLAHVFRKFNVVSELAYDQLQVNPAIISRHLDPLPVRLEARF